MTELQCIDLLYAIGYVALVAVAVAVASIFNCICLLLLLFAVYVKCSQTYVHRASDFAILSFAIAAHIVDWNVSN